MGGVGLQSGCLWFPLVAELQQWECDAGVGGAWWWCETEVTQPPDPLTGGTTVHAEWGSPVGKGPTKVGAQWNGSPPLGWGETAGGGWGCAG